LSDCIEHLKRSVPKFWKAFTGNCQKIGPTASTKFIRAQLTVI